MSSAYQPVAPRKGLAITSLVLGIISVPTLGLLGVGAITGIVLGVRALNKIKQNPQAYTGKGIAIGGIVTSAISLGLSFVLGILAAIALPRLTEDFKFGRERAAVKALVTIHQNQAHYKATKERFATLRELEAAGLIDAVYVNGQSVNGYTYVESEVSGTTYCVHAERVSESTAHRDFVICEDGRLRYVESKKKGVVKRGEGTALDGDDPAAPETLPRSMP